MGNILEGGNRIGVLVSIVQYGLQMPSAEHANPWDIISPLSLRVFMLYYIVSTVSRVAFIHAIHSLHRGVITLFWISAFHLRLLPRHDAGALAFVPREDVLGLGDFGEEEVLAGLPSPLNVSCITFEYEDQSRAKVATTRSLVDLIPPGYLSCASLELQVAESKLNGLLRCGNFRTGFWPISPLEKVLGFASKGLPLVPEDFLTLEELLAVKIVAKQSEDVKDLHAGHISKVELACGAPLSRASPLDGSSGVDRPATGVKTRARIKKLIHVGPEAPLSTLPFVPTTWSNHQTVVAFLSPPPTNMGDVLTKIGYLGLCVRSLVDLQPWLVLGGSWGVLVDNSLWVNVVYPRVGFLGHLGGFFAHFPLNMMSRYSIQGTYLCLGGSISCLVLVHVELNSRIDEGLRSCYVHDAMCWRTGKRFSRHVHWLQNLQEHLNGTKVPIPTLF
ncbi:uncharacterized protein G2W53_018501 [Senna tora]|uniref:Uncharacterized protein n=1 Tax=Senna tora TaxID=362788 RepID=A0A834TTU8_9FABA|nr:uncharacterized protein G2W53_018501 [Senna tora]